VRGQLDSESGRQRGPNFPVSDPPSHHPGPQRLKYLRPDAVRAHLARDPRLIVPVGTTEQHGPHLPLGADTILVERLAGELSAEFGILLAPTVEYGVNAKTRTPYPGNATVRRKTLHRWMNDLIGSWEESGVEEFVILTAHADPGVEKEAREAGASGFLAKGTALEQLVLALHEAAPKAS